MSAENKGKCLILRAMLIFLIAQAIGKTVEDPPNQ